jgi:GNAT superfamily N-acetyltransferase
LTFRDATSADVGALVELIESAYRGDASRGGWTTEADLLHGQRTDAAAVAAVIADEAARIMVVERAGELIACCQLEERGGAGGTDNAGGPVAGYFGMFAVRPAEQGGGVGRQVLAEAERIARGWGASELHMTVIVQRPELIAYYERRGYRRTGQLSPFPYEDERFGLPQRDDLAFELLVKEL